MIKITYMSTILLFLCDDKDGHQRSCIFNSFREDRILGGSACQPGMRKSIFCRTIKDTGSIFDCYSLDPFQRKKKSQQNDGDAMPMLDKPLIHLTVLLP